MLRYLPMVLGLASIVCASCSEDDLGKVNRLADEMCACKDVACSTSVLEKASATISDETARRLLRDQEHEFMRAVEQLARCASKLLDQANLPAEMPFLPTQKIPEFPSAKD